MLSTIGNWITTIPLADPWHSIVLVAEVLAFAVILHFVWELGFFLAGRLVPAKSRLTSRARMPAPQKLGELAVNTAGQDELNPKI
jgi:hypothetical protein